MTKDFKLSGIYKITNKINGKFYIGSSNSIFYRWLNHASDLTNGNHTNYKLQRAFNKYGLESFSFDVIELHPGEGLNKREQYYLDTMCKAKEYIENKSLFFNKNTYNIKPKVEGLVGLPMREEVIVRAVRTRGFGKIFKIGSDGSFIKEYELQKHAAEDNNISRNTVSLSIKRKSCPKNKDFYFTYEDDYDPDYAPKKYKPHNKGIKGVVKHNTNIPVYAYDIYGRFFRKFNSGKDTAKFFNTDPSSICRMLDNPKKKVLHNHGIHLYNLFSEKRAFENKIDIFKSFEEDGNIEVYTLFNEYIGKYSKETITNILKCHPASVVQAKNKNKVLKSFYFL